MSAPDAPPPTEGRFDSPADLQADHARLVKEVGADVLEPGHAARIAAFIRRAVATGALLEAKDDRLAAQGLINFWTARLASASRGAGRKTAGAGPAADPPLPRFEDTLLAEFDPGTVRLVAEAADRWLATLPEAGRATARRILLRLVRLAPGGRAFEPVPTVRAALYDLDPSPAAVDELIAGLAASGVVRLTPGDTPEVDRIGLGSLELLTAWKALTAWLDQRLQFRETAAAWDRGGRRPGDLLPAEDLEEALTYHDRDQLERAFIEESRYQERRRNERNRLRMYVYAALALVGVLLALGAVAGWRSARRSAAEARRSAAEAARQRDSLFEKQRLSAMSALTRALAEIGIGNEAERRIALRRLDALAADTGSYPEITSFLAEYAAILDRVRHGASSPEELNRVQLAALDAGHRLRDRVLRSATPELVAVLADERKLAFEIVQFCAAQTVATFAERPYREADPYVREFWILYWGEMAQVEGRRVESAMVRFGRTLQEIDENVRRHAPAGLNAQAPAPRVRAHNARQAFQQFAYEGSDEPWTRRAEEYIRDATVDPADVRRLRDDLANLTQALDAERHQDLTLLRTPAAQP